MFEKIANKFQTFVLIGLVTLLCAVFILQFGGPQAQGCTEGGSSYIAQVYDRSFNSGDFEAAYTLANPGRLPPERARALHLREAVMDGMVNAALLAHEAERVGFRVSEDDVWTRIRDDGTLLLTIGGEQGPGGAIPVSYFQNDSGNFDPDRAKEFIQNYLRRSIREFAEWQSTEMLANRMRQTLLASISVSPREVWNAYVRDAEKAQIHYVRFAPSFYANALRPTDEEITTWMAANTEAVDQEYTANRHRYTGLEPQVRAEHILIKASADASDEVKASARARAEALLARARAGENFEDLARENSEDTGSARRGGDLGYNPHGRMVGPFDTAQFALDVGQISDIVETRFGYHIIKVVGKREGDVPEAEAKREIGERLYREARASELAREAATAALAWVKQDGRSWDDLDEHLAHPEAEAVDPETGESAEEATTDRDPLAPHVEESREFGPTDTPISGPFDTGDLVHAVFQMTAGATPDEPLALGQEFVIFIVDSRQAATEEGLTDERRESLMNGLLVAKQREALKVHLRQLRARAERNGKLRIDESILRYPGADAGTPES
ncbi:MAG: hypothetical protein GXP55_00445 [Deltaproteobacteria bacterium]|nr:hypothetical protein [Deltaproteobacteria bacterium]